MSEYIKKQAKTHEVTHEFSGRQHFFKVQTKTGNEHSVVLQLGCDCEYMSTQGVAQGRICSHIIAVLNDINKKGNVSVSFGAKQMVQLRRNACTNLVRRGNRKLNEVRISDGESKAHQDKKIELCKRILAAGKHFMTEAIFTDGGRADILVLDDFKAIEIVHSESNDSITAKADYYPEGILIEVVRC